MALNLSRNSKVFYTTNVNSSTGVINSGGFYDKNTFELQVLDGFSVTQNTNNETVTVNEAGASPLRGQRSFNTSLAPADFSFSTYIRPKYASNVVSAEEDVLWNALFSSQSAKTVGSNISLSTVGGTISYNGSNTLTVTGTALGWTGSGLAAGDVVMISGISGATGPADAATAKNYFNAVATVGASPSNTTITFVYNTPFASAASAFTLTTTNTLIVNKITDNQIIIGSGGTGSFTTMTYQNLTTSADYGILTISGGSSMPLPTSGDIYNVNLTSITLSGGLTTKFIATAIVDGTPSASSLRLKYLNPTITATTFSGITASSAITLTKANPVAYNNATEASAFSHASTATSDANQLLKFGLLFIIDTVCYAIDNCALNQATIDFGLDGIATVQWTGQGTQVRKFGDNITATSGSFGGNDASIVGKYTVKNSGSSVNYITNRLSSAKITAINELKDSSSNIKFAAGDVITLAITGGSITINNNITYLTPSILGVVNTPVQYFTGTRAVTGTLTAYLRTGASAVAGTIADTGELLSDMLAVVGTSTEPMFSLLMSIGGTGTNTPKVQLEMPSVVLAVPTIDSQQTITTSINFTAEGSYTVTGTTSTTGFDLSKSNDLTVRYYSK
jgi:hypothetical protein